MTSFVIPSPLTPLTDVFIDNGNISPVKRIKYKNFNGTILTNALEIHANDRNTLESVIKFHAFITRSERGIFQYDRRSVATFRHEDTSQDPLDPKDFNDMLSLLYLDKTSERQAEEPVSFSEMYSTYLSQDQEILDLIDTFNTRLDIYESTGRRILYDYTYWSLVKDFSIIDKIIGQPDACTKGVFSCQCGRQDIRHHATSASDSRSTAS